MVKNACLLIILLLCSLTACRFERRSSHTPVPLNPELVGRWTDCRPHVINVGGKFDDSILEFRKDGTLFVENKTSGNILKLNFSSFDGGVIEITGDEQYAGTAHAEVSSDKLDLSVAFKSRQPSVFKYEEGYPLCRVKEERKEDDKPPLTDRYPKAGEMAAVTERTVCSPTDKSFDELLRARLGNVSAEAYDKLAIQLGAITLDKGERLEVLDFNTHKPYGELQPGPVYVSVHVKVLNSRRECWVNLEYITVPKP